MKAARLLAVVGLMAVLTSTGSFAAAKGSHPRAHMAQGSGVTGRSLAQDLTCNIYCDDSSTPTETTHPGTVSGCLADCGEICGSECHLI